MLNVEILRVHPGLSAGMYPGSWSWCHPDMWKQRAFWHSLTMQWLISQCDGSCKDYKTMQNKRGIHKLHRKTGRQICTANNLEKVVFPAGRPRQNLMVPLTLLAKRHPISRTGNFCASSPCSSPQPSRPKLAKSAEEADVYTDLCFQEYRGVAADTQDHEPGTWEAPMGRALTLVRIRVGVKLERRWHRKCSLTSQTFRVIFRSSMVCQASKEETKKLTLRQKTQPSEAARFMLSRRRTFSSFTSSRNSSSILWTRSASSWLTCIEWVQKQMA